MGDSTEGPDSAGVNGGMRYTMAEAARAKGVSYHTVSRAVRSGKLPAQRLGRMALIAARDLQAWRPMRERAPRKYRQPEPREPSLHERPVLSDSGTEAHYADRLVLAGEQLLEVASSESISRFGDWVARWLASSLRKELAVIWQVDKPHGPAQLYGAFGLDTAMLPAQLSDSAVRSLNHLAEREPVITLDRKMLKQLDADSWLPVVDGGWPIFLPLRSGSRCVGCAVVTAAGEEDPLSAEERNFAQRLSRQAAFAIEHVEMRHTSRKQLLATASVFDELPLQLVAVDLQGILVYGNKEFTTLWGEEVHTRYIGRHYSHFLRSFRCESLDGVEVRLEDHPLSRAMRGDKVDESRFLVPEALDSSMAFSLSARPTFDDDGNQSGAILTARDVTAELDSEAGDDRSPIAMLVAARRRVELLAHLSTEIAERRAAEDIFGIVANRVCDILDADYSLVMTPTVSNQMIIRATHNMSDSMAGRVLNRLSFPSAILAMAQRDLIYVGEDEAGTGGREMLDDGGARAALLIPLVDGDEALGVLAMHYADVDRLRQVDPELARAVGRQCGHAVHLRNVVIELEASRRRLLTTLDQLPQSVVILDELDGHIVAMNRESQALWGPSEERLGQHASDIAMLDEEGRAIPMDRHPFLRPLKTRRTEFGVPLITRDSAGNLVDMLANISPVIGRSGELRGAVAVLQRREHFKPIDQAKDEFISVVAHEIRNPLTSLRGNLQLLERRLKRLDTEATEREVDRVSGVIEQVDRIGDLVSRMLDVSRADLGKLSIDPGETDAVQLARSAIADVEAHLGDRRVTFDAPETLRVEWDRVRVQQILVNLLTNAVRYAPDGDIEITVDTGDDDRVAISVRDHGPGVPPRLRRRLFRLYYRFDDGEETADGLAAQQRGLGIGLYISARLARAHGGKLAVDEAEGGGAVFTLTLPRIASQS